VQAYSYKDCTTKTNREPTTIYRILKDVEPLSREKEGELLERLRSDQKGTDPNRSNLSGGYALCYVCGDWSLLSCFLRVC
jgi:hypothetical protein